MKKLLRVLAGVTVAAGALLALGFVAFASMVTREPTRGDVHADGIVVLTGESRRIAEGAGKRGNGQPHLKQTLAGALISLSRGRIHISPAPARRRRDGS